MGQSRIFFTLFCIFIRAFLFVNGRLLNSFVFKVPEICLTLKSEDYDSIIAQDSDSPYEIIIQKVAPAVYEVIIQGKKGELFTDFILKLESPNAGRFSSHENFETFGCNDSAPNRVTLIRASKEERNVPKRQIVSHFYQMNGSKTVHFRASVYYNRTTFWTATNRNTILPVIH